MAEITPDTIIWDFDGTLIPNDPYDSEQTLMMYKLYEAGQRVPVITHVLARLLIYADQKEHLRKVFKRFSFFNRFLFPGN